METKTTAKTKKCSRCGRILPASAFHRSSAAWDGLQFYCKECNGKSGSAYRSAEEQKLEKPASARRLKATLSECYVARDQSGDVWLFDSKPFRTNGTFEPVYGDSMAVQLSRNTLPGLTWENSPVLVCVEIREYRPRE